MRCGHNRRLDRNAQATRRTATEQDGHTFGANQLKRRILVATKARKCSKKELHQSRRQRSARDASFGLWEYISSFHQIVGAIHVEYHVEPDDTRDPSRLGRRSGQQQSQQHGAEPAASKINTCEKLGKARGDAASPSGTSTPGLCRFGNPPL